MAAERRHRRPDPAAEQAGADRRPDRHPEPDPRGGVGLRLRRRAAGAGQRHRQDLPLELHADGRRGLLGRPHGRLPQAAAARRPGAAGSRRCSATPTPWRAASSGTPATCRRASRAVAALHSAGAAPPGAASGRRRCHPAVRRRRAAARHRGGRAPGGLHASGNEPGNRRLFTYPVDQLAEVRPVGRHGNRLHRRRHRLGDRGRRPRQRHRHQVLLEKEGSIEVPDPAIRATRSPRRSPIFWATSSTPTRW